MSLTVGNSPFGADRGTFNTTELPDHVLYLQDYPRRVRAVLDAVTVVDTEDARLLHETGKLAVLCVPMEQIRSEVLEESDSHAHDEHKGEVRRWHLRIGDRLIQDVATEYVAPPDAFVSLAGLASIKFSAMDRWFEEDEPIYAHFKDPYHRVDVRSSSRHVVVRHGDTVLADSTRPRMLFETGGPTRYYVPFADVRIDLLQLSETVSECPYKGDGQHWHLMVDGERIDDVAWSLPHPLPEGFAAAEHICFYPDKVHVEVDGEPLVEPSLR